MISSFYLVVLIIVLLVSFRVIWFLLMLSNVRFLVMKSRRYQNIKKAKKKVLFIGDSTCVGTGAKPEDSIAGRFGFDYRNWSVYNLGVNGAKLSGVVKQLQKVRGERFDLVVILAGNNDVFWFIPLKKSEESIKKLVGLAKSVGRRVVLMPAGNPGLAPLFPRPFKWIFTFRTLRLRRVFLNLASKLGFTFVDIYNTRITDPFSRNPFRYYSSDGVHPNDEGYRVYYESLKKVLIENRIL